MFSQTVPPFEVLLVCDGPLGDGLNEVINHFEAVYPEQFRVIRLEENGGLGNALRIGLDSCQCEIVARMDSDDISLNDRCEKELSVIRETACDIVGTFVAEFEGDPVNVVRYKEGPTDEGAIREYAKTRNPFNHPTVMFKKSAVLKAGGYKDFYLLEDYYLWIRMLEDGCKAKNIAEPLLLMRTDEGMYARRGGLRYLASQLRLVEFMRAIGWLHLGEAIRNGAVRACGSLIPSGVRRFLFHSLLRRAVDDE